MLRPITRIEQYLAKMAGVTNTAPAPLTRLEQYLAKIAGVTNTAPTPLTRVEQYLNIITIGGGGSNVEEKTYTPEEDITQFILENPRNAMPKFLTVSCEKAAADMPVAALKNAMTCFEPTFRLGTNGGYNRYSSLVRIKGSDNVFKNYTSTGLTNTLAGLSDDNSQIAMPAYGTSKYAAGVSYTIRLYY